MTSVTLRGTPFRVDGALPAVGSAAPALTLTTGELADVSLAHYAGKRKVLNIVPSLDTPTCATSMCMPVPGCSVLATIRPTISASVEKVRK